MRQAAAPPGHGLSEYRTAFHVHGQLSHDSEGSIEEIARAAAALGFDAVLMTDHYEPENIARAARGMHKGVLFVPGVEVRGNGGSILTFHLSGDFDKRASPSDRLAEFERQGAVSVLGHVERIRDWELEPFHGFEIYNLHAQFREASRLAVLGRALFMPADRFLDGGISTPVQNLRLWDRELARGRHLAPFAGHDAHANVRILGVTLGTYAEVLRLFSTRVLAPELSADAIADAVRRGRTIVTFDYLGDAAGFAMSYGDPGASLRGRALPGDTARFEAAHALEVRLPHGTPDGASVVVVKDGETILHEPGLGLTIPLPGPGIYRVEVYLDGRLWILPSPIWVE